MVVVLGSTTTGGDQRSPWDVEDRTPVDLNTRKVLLLAEKPV